MSYVHVPAEVLHFGSLKRNALSIFSPLFSETIEACLDGTSPILTSGTFLGHLKHWKLQQCHPALLCHLDHFSLHACDDYGKRAASVGFH